VSASYLSSDSDSPRAADVASSALEASNAAAGPCGASSIPRSRTLAAATAALVRFELHQ
jgi:hypothetical protein